MNNSRNSKQFAIRSIKIKQSYCTGLSLTCNGRGSRQITSSLFHKGNWQGKKGSPNCNPGFDHVAISASKEQVFMITQTPLMLVEIYLLRIYFQGISMMSFRCRGATSWEAFKTKNVSNHKLPSITGVCKNNKV